MSTDTPRLPLSPDDYFDHLQADLAAISAVPHTGLDAVVAACPGWDVADTIDHLADVLEIMAGRVHTPAGETAPRWPGRADAPALERFSAAAAGFLDALEATDPDSPRSTWSGEDRAAFYWRRVAHETLVHRWDIESAVGDAAAIDPLMAVDGLDEFARVALPYARRRAGLPGGGESVHLHVTDPDVGTSLPAGEWTITFGSDAVAVEAIHGKADMAFRGRATDLLLLVWNRSSDGVEAFGDGDPVAWWSANVTL